MIRTLIKSTGRHVPSRVVTNEALSQLMDTSDDWIRQRAGIEKRHWVPENQEIGSSDLGMEAAKNRIRECELAGRGFGFDHFCHPNPGYFSPPVRVA